MSIQPHPNCAHAVVALIATRGRDDLLLTRAIPSVLGQTHPSERLMIVLDESKEERSASDMAEFEKRVRSRCGDFRVTILRNRRTPSRAAGAWNTGIDQLHRDAAQATGADQCFVAILDDDDMWEPDHLELCVEQAIAGNLSMVGAGLIRHDAASDTGHRHAIPERLDPHELFVCGQHIQGSNLFVRLDMLLKAGMFDEHLPSCTDRDLCIRLADLPDLRFGRIKTHTVHHYADPRPDRLSTARSSHKLDGLTRFWYKYADRFDAEAQDQFARRAHELFGWTVPRAQVTSETIPELSLPPRTVDLVVGFVTDAVVPEHACGLLEDLCQFGAGPGVASLKIVVVENGPIPKTGERPLHDLVSELRARNLYIDLITIERQQEDWTQGYLVDTPDPTKQRLPIAVSRTVLNTYVARAAADRPSAWAWILDDDKRLSIRVDRGDGCVVDRPSPDLAALCALQDSGVDVVIGPDTDAAPLPFTATLRVQLVDLAHHLRVLATFSPRDMWPDRTTTDAVTRASLRDSYYDLSRYTEHLETPFVLQFGSGSRTAGEVLASIGSRIERLLAGEAVFRPLTVGARALYLNAAESSVQRGGSTIFFDPKILLEYPQNLARFGNRYVRRSDMLVSQLMQDQRGLKIVMHAAVGVRHDRSCTKRAALDDNALWKDVLGYALYRSMNEILQHRTPEQRQASLLAWNSAELIESVRLVKKYIDERLAAFSLSGCRIVGLSDMIRKTAEDLASPDSAWTDDETQNALQRIIEEMSRICDMFEPSAFAQFEDRIKTSVSDADIRNTFQSMDGLISEYRATNQTPAPDDHAWAITRQRRARAILEKAYGIKSLRLLGTGGEGVVFTDDAQVYKVFDLLKWRPNHNTLETLTRLSTEIEDPKYMYPITSVEYRDETLLLVYPFEPSEQYVGGRGSELIGLLRECKAHGVVFRNMHPKNLRVSATGLKLIDYGSDIRPFTEGGYRSMAERAFLTWRWAHRSDLVGLMRKALTDKSLPELDGFDRFWSALCDENPSATRMVSEFVDPIVLDSSSQTVLDYGCGKKACSTIRLAEAGLSVVGFDPDDGLEKRWRVFEELPRGLVLTTDRVEAISHAPFDAVVCSLVLCELEDGPEYEQVLTDLRHAVREDGLIIITVCNPFATFGGPTPLHSSRDLPEDVTYTDRFRFIEIAESGSGRREFHRPLSQLERDLLRHGIRVECRQESEAIDLERFEPASDFMTLVCRPIPTACPDRSVSLVIKTCAMEARTIERQVEHLVRQLEGPRAFHERVLAIDSRRDRFVRQHADADLKCLHHAADRLQRQGLIDRVIIGPEEGDGATRINTDWFGIECRSSHTGSGAPLAMPLSVFESCSSDYILQVDSDLLIGRRDRSHDYLREMIEAIESSPAAVTASLNIARKDDMPISAVHDGKPWRVEARGCLLHRERLLAARPYPNTTECGVPTLSWHRSMDLAARDGRIQSLRGGGADTFFVHPSNEFKRSASDWMLLIDLIEKGHIPPEQFGLVDLVGGPLLWITGSRSESLIVLMTGRNVPPGRACRCLESVLAQEWKDWGAIIIDDGSSEWSREHLRMALEPWADRVTLIQPRERRGQLANMTLAIRHACKNPDSIILTLDLDDALIGTRVFDRVIEEHNRGADVTVGSMLRTDKQVEYPVTFNAPREARGGNVWQHLRTFRKRLFEAIPDHELRIDGRYVDIAVDWAFMLPIVEMAKHPVWITEPLYLYEPSGMGKGRDRVERERQIAAIVSKPGRRPEDGRHEICEEAAAIHCETESPR